MPLRIGVELQLHGFLTFFRGRGLRCCLFGRLGRIGGRGEGYVAEQKPGDDERNDALVHCNLVQEWPGG